MKKKPLFYAAGSAAGILLVILAFLWMDANKNAGGVMLGLGVALLCVSVTGFLRIVQEKRYPEAARQAQIDYADERNMQIRCRAKARAADLCQWFVIGVAFLQILAGVPMWLTLVTVGAFLLYYVLSAAFAIKYQKEM